MRNTITWLLLAGALAWSLTASAITMAQPLAHGCDYSGGVCQQSGSACAYPRVCDDFGMGAGCDCYASGVRAGTHAGTRR